MGRILSDEAILRLAEQEANDFLGDWSQHFKPGARFTLIMRMPFFPKQGIVITNDTIGQVIEELKFREAETTPTPSEESHDE